MCLRCDTLRHDQVWSYGGCLGTTTWVSQCNHVHFHWQQCGTATLRSLPVTHVTWSPCSHSLNYITFLTNPSYPRSFYLLHCQACLKKLCEEHAASVRVDSHSVFFCSRYLSRSTTHLCAAQKGCTFGKQNRHGSKETVCSTTVYIGELFSFFFDRGREQKEKGNVNSLL